MNIQHLLVHQKLMLTWDLNARSTNLWTLALFSQATVRTLTSVMLTSRTSVLTSWLDGFDVHVFDQYLSPNNHGPTALPPSHTGHGYPNPSGSFTLPGIHSNSTPTWTRKSPTSIGTFSNDEVIQSEDAATRKSQVKTKQMSPDHHSSSCT